jgi:amino acid adenylation domain-containing protein
MKAGAAFVFLDPGYPMARLNGIVQQVGASVILASLGQAPLWRGSSVPVLIIDNVSIESLPSATNNEVKTRVTPANALYVIFTSGSTGNPKGCVVEHHSFLTCARAQAARSHMTPSSRVLQGASYSFDVSVMEMLTALTVGACICVPNDSIRKRSVTDVINDFRITWAFLTPSLVKFIKPSDIPHLKTLILGGEALTAQNIRTWAGHVRLFNGYGPSECTIAASAHAITSPEEDPSNIGKALGGICWITDPDDYNRLAPLGAIGELVVEGSIVARGYLNNAEKTAEVFIENPAWAKRAAMTSDEPETRRMYRTGDLAYFNTNGDIMFVGRKDAQVKVRGQRMELGEIETHLTLNKKVQHAMVAYPKSGPCKRQLVGIVSFARLGATTNANNEVVLVDPELTDTVSAEVADMARELGAVVPSYMIPEVWVVVQSFPLLLSGKLNRKRVEQWLGSMDKATHQRVCGMGESFRVQAPSTEIEALIHNVWAEVLKLPADEIGVTQEFSTLGGDSILAMLVVAKLKAQGLRITMTDVVSARTIAALASRVGGTGGVSGAIVPVAAPVKVAEEITNELFDLTPIQQFYANFTLKSDYLSKQTNKRFNHTFCLKVKKTSLSAVAVQEAIEALVNRHGMLRARFQKDKTAACGWRQYISTETTDSYRFRTWDNFTVEQVTPSLEEARQGLDIEKGPLMAVDFVTVNKGEQYLMIVAHHLVVDLVSWNTILGDLEDYLQSKSFTAETPYPFSAWAKEQKQHAIDNFAPDKVLPLRVPPANYKYWDMERRINIIRDAQHHTIALSERDTATLLTTCNKVYGAEPMDMLCSALAHSFSYVFRDRAPPTMFRYGHGREPINDHVDPAGTVGWFTTLSPIHVAVRSRDNSISVLQRTMDARKTLAANGLGFFASRYHHPGGAKAFAALDRMEVMINYLGTSDNQRRSSSSSGGGGASLFDMSDAVQGGLGADGQEVKGFALFSISAEVTEARLYIRCVWNKKMRRQGAIQKWFCEYENAVRDIAHQARKQELGGARAAIKQLR